MTRENKLALVVGFGLVLFVGILISDHFSAARQQQAADLLPPSDVLADARRNDRALIDMAPDEPAAPPMASNTSELANERDTMSSAFVGVEAPSEVAVRTVDLQQLRNLPLVGAGAEAEAGSETGATAESSPAAPKSTLPAYEVQAGETLFSICREHYGEGALADKLASFNDITDPASLREGQRLRLPAADVLRGKSDNPADATPERSRPPSTALAMVDYKLQEGDTLVKVARKVGGAKVTWNDIYDLNKSIIDDPDNVPAGITIKVPRRQ